MISVDTMLPWESKEMDTSQSSGPYNDNETVSGAEKEEEEIHEEDGPITPEIRSDELPISGSQDQLESNPNQAIWAQVWRQDVWSIVASAELTPKRDFVQQDRSEMCKIVWWTCCYQHLWKDKQMRHPKVLGRNDHNTLIALMKLNLIMPKEF